MFVGSHVFCNLYPLGRDRVVTVKICERGLLMNGVKERGKERYCWRAGVMSRNEGGEEEELFV